jgi:very-short-patch-repair endonuclease
VDLYWHEHRLVVEIDGSQHTEAAGLAADAERTAWLEARGLRVLRLDNHYVLKETENAVATILLAIEEGLPSP